MKSLKELSSEIDSLDDLLDMGEDHWALMNNTMLSIIEWVKKVEADNAKLVNEIKELQNKLYQYKTKGEYEPHNQEET